MAQAIGNIVDDLEQLTFICNASKAQLALFFNQVKQCSSWAVFEQDVYFKTIKPWIFLVVDNPDYVLALAGVRLCFQIRATAQVLENADFTFISFEHNFRVPTCKRSLLKCI